MNAYDTRLSKEMDLRARQIIPGGIQYNFLSQDTTSRIYINQARGMRLTDLDGNEYLDFYGKSGAVFVGHGHPRFLHQLQKCIQTMSVDLTEYTVLAGEAIVKYIPSAQAVRFSLSGTEAVQNALRLARAYTGRPVCIRFAGHFHGTAANVLHPQVTPDRVLPDIDYQTVELPWNDEAVLEQYLTDHPDDVAAVIMEPVCINGGGITTTRKYLAAVRRLCDKFHVLLIFDEIITSIRVGIHGIEAVTGIIPDLCLLGKSIGNGMPGSVIAGRREILELYESCAVVHGGTFNGHPLGMSAVLATFEILQEEPEMIYGRLSRNMKLLYQILETEAQKAGVPVVLQGCENCMVCNCSPTVVSDNRFWSQDIIMRNDILRKCFQKYGIFLSPVSRIYPNIQLNENDLDFFQDRVRYALKETYTIINRTVNEQ